MAVENGTEFNPWEGGEHLRGMLGPKQHLINIPDPIGCCFRLGISELGSNKPGKL